MENKSARDRADAMLDAWNQHDYDQVASHLTTDLVFVDHTRGRTSTGPDGYVNRFRHVLDAFPNMQGETVSAFVEGSLLVHETTWRGQHTAPLELPGYDHVPPTKEWMTMHVVTYMEFDDGGQIRAIRTYGDSGEVPISALPVGVG